MDNNTLVVDKGVEKSRKVCLGYGNSLLRGKGEVGRGPTD